MKTLKNILQNVAVRSITGSAEVQIHTICFDSRNVKKNDVFVAQRGVTVDGHHYIDKAIDNGASVVVCEDIPDEKHEAVVYVQVENSSVALAVLAANYYDNPSHKLQLVGITGTNGKTTIATLLYDLFIKAGYKAGLLSTVKVMVDTAVHKATHTTPDSLTINQYLLEMVAQGVTHCFMEVSSHGIDQKRTEGLYFAGGVFTNLSHDHLDYHTSFAAYRDVKKHFFDTLPKSAFALTNKDDKNGLVMLQNTRATKMTYALKTVADFKAKILEKQFSGTLLNIAGTEIWVKLIGTFNAYNLLAVYGVAVSLGFDQLEVLRLLSELESVNGRFQCQSSKENIIAIIDYAHTPDALKNVLETINDIRSGNENVITVIGCGGNRDRGKRPKMAHIASQLSNQVVFTSDNPRDENPQAIINDMEKGVLVENQKKVLSILDRRQAIKTAYKLAQPHDIILIAGKGHETYQEIEGKRYHFNDAEEITNCFKL